MAMENHEIEKNTQKGKGFAWVAALLVALGCICTCVFLFQSTGIFREMFKGIGVELPLATRFLITTYSWFYPLVFIGAAVLVIAKEFVLGNIQRRLAATVIVFLVVVSSVGLVQYVLYLPLLELVKRLSQAK
jgi:uncharacterized membrane protein